MIKLNKKKNLCLKKPLMSGNVEPRSIIKDKDRGIGTLLERRETRPPKKGKESC